MTDQDIFRKVWGSFQSEVSTSTKILAEEKWLESLNLTTHQILKIDPTGRIKSSGEKEVVIPFLLESLPKPVLYMVLTDLRRVIATKGKVWILARKTPLTIAERTHYWWHSIPSIEIHHFISPEDWGVEKEETILLASKRFSFLGLQRLPDLRSQIRFEGV